MSKVNLCDICDFQGGSQPPKSQWTTLQQDGYIRMLQIRDFTQPGKVKAEYVKLTNTTKCCLKDDILIENNNKFLSKQDIVIENITDAAMFIIIFILLGKELFIYSFIEYIFKKLKNIFTN